MLDKIIQIGLLFDFYGRLLTEKQQQAILLHYYDDLSLSEIAEKLEISRQGVYDHLQRGEDILREYEKKLGLITKYSRIGDRLNNLKEFVSNEEIESRIKDRLINEIEEIKKQL